ncbi:hypothetical protein LOTGIDRAFT_229774 [Lottia gigantea]|uniref:C2H2-type domain-containing protein n=1 Tax=Lottia gigantea TaxID=225164 RepID=V4B2M6_LOTGI|nr:hypothetical protein LOTGIDRAFT_229774 [Lottia gigantea]ESO82739.1 hypothetical protein LOTGIDRAFT_229774 [Lottia gigantea]
MKETNLTNRVEIIDVTPKESEISTEVKNHIVCDIEGCNKTFTSGGSYLFHKNKSHPEPKQSTVPVKPVKNSNVVYRYRYFCPLVDCRHHSTKHFTKLKYLKQHYGKVHGDKKYKCSMCQKGFAFERDLNRHKETCGQVFECVSCKCPYTTPEAVLTHCRRHGHEPPSSAKSSRRGNKHLEKSRIKENSSSPVPMNPCLIVINQSSQPVVTPSPSPQHPRILPKPTYSSATIVRGLPSATNNLQSLCIGLPQVGISAKSSKLINDQDQANRINKDDLTRDQSPVCSVAEIQTDIYGIETLTSLNSVSLASTGTQADPPQKLSSTGMQTSMSFLPKKTTCSIAGTQTSTENILDRAIKTAKIPTSTQIRKAFKKKTCEVQTNTTFCNKRRKRKIWKKMSHVGCGPDPVISELVLDINNSTQTNLSFFHQQTNLLQNIETQTPYQSIPSSSRYLELLPDYHVPCKKRLLEQNLDLLADATLTNFMPMNNTTMTPRRPTLGDPSLGSTFSTSMDSESQTVTSASDLDHLLQSDTQNNPLSTVIDIQTQTVEEELLNFLMNNMETQTTDDLFPEVGLSDIETQTLATGLTYPGEINVGNRPQSDRMMSSTSTGSDRVLLFEPLVTTETQTNVNQHDLTDMETQTTFNTIDFFTNLTDSHTQTTLFM